MLELISADDALWKQRYRATAIYTSQIAKLDPSKGLIADNRTGTLQWQAWDVTANSLRQLTETPDGNSNYLYLAPRGDWIYYLNDYSGNELGHYVRMPYESGPVEDITPDLPYYSSFGFAMSDSGNRLAWMCAYDQQFFIYCVDVADDGSLSNLRLIYRSDRLLEGVWLSYDGELVATMSTECSGTLDCSIVVFDAKSGEKVGELWEEGSSLGMCCFAPYAGDARILATTNRTGTETLLIWDARNDERGDLDLASIEGSLYAFDWSDQDLIVFRSMHAAVQRMYVHNLNTGKTHALPYPDGTTSSAYFVPQSDEIFSHWQSATNPSYIIGVSTATGTMRTVLDADNVAEARPCQSITFPSADGQMIQAWLALPTGDGPFPVILETHGGPTAVQNNIFNPAMQAWLDHGYAYISVNYRGSTTFGREFEQKIWGDLGHWEVEDMVAARAWLIEQNIAIPDQILLTGWSYGGYLTLLALGKTPDLWAGGMAGIAIADWVMSYEDSAETLRGYQVSIFGGTPAEKLEQYQRSSPITYAEQIKAPILIIQGRNDTRTPARPIEAFEQKLKALDKHIKVDWFDTGHAGSFTSTELRIQHQSLMLDFAYHVLS